MGRRSFTVRLSRKQEGSWSISWNNSWSVSWGVSWSIFWGIICHAEKARTFKIVLGGSKESKGRRDCATYLSDQQANVCGMEAPLFLKNNGTKS